MKPAWSLGVAALVLLTTAVGCAPSAGSSGNGVGRAYPGSSVPAARPVPAAAGLYARIPRACSAVDPATLRAIAPGSGAGQENDESGAGILGDHVADHICTWGAAGPNWTRTLTVTIELETGDGARINATSEYGNELPDIGSPQTVSGLGDKAQLVEQQLKTGSSAQLHVLRQNVVITIAYIGADAGGSAMTGGEMRNATVAAARAVLAALP